MPVDALVVSRFISEQVQSSVVVMSVQSFVFRFHMAVQVGIVAAAPLAMHITANTATHYTTTTTGEDTSTLTSELVSHYIGCQ